MFKLINSFFNAIAIFLRGASESLESSADKLHKSAAISRAAAAEKYKEEIARMVEKGGYESEETMRKEHEEILAKIKKRKR